jgi:beta-D-xylosidase 4
MMNNKASGYDPLNIPPYQWWSEGLHGPLEPCVRLNADGDSTCKCPTSFPSPSTLGNAFNASLYYLIGEAIGIEGRAISNLRPHNTDIGDGLTYWSPTINLQRDPRWGRNQEVPGEDPLLTSVYASSFVDGLQGGGRGRSRGGNENTDIDSRHHDSNSTDSYSRVRVGAACKHFVANSLEEWGGVSRHNFDAHIDEQDLHNYYLPPFEHCSKVAVGVMCSYNAINGIPACVNPWLLNDMLRDKFKFNGYVVTDCGALADVVTGHHYAIDASQTAALAKKATVDVNCGDGEFFPSGLQAAYSDGRVNAATIEESFTRMATIQFRLGLFDGPKSFEPDKGIAMIGSERHQQLALEAALQGIVLLQSRNNFLPLVRLKKKTIAVIGPHMNATKALLSNYHGEKCRCNSDDDVSTFGLDPNQETSGFFGTTDHSWDCLTTPLDAIRQKMKLLYRGEGTVEAINGCTVGDDRINEIDAAQELAARSEAVILMLGIDNSQESEGRDRYNTTLPGLQTQLLEAVLDVAADRTVVVLIHGGSMSLGPDVLSRAEAILSAGYGGEMASEAIASVLFGEYNPTGKLSSTWYPPSFVDDIPLTEMGLRVGVGRTYLYYKKQAEFLFGHGLSYSLWKLQFDDGIHALELHEKMCHSLKLRVKIENLGPYPGHQTILLFWRPNMAKTPTSHEGLQKKLIGFSNTPRSLETGEVETVEFIVSLDNFRLWDPDEGRHVVSPGNYILELQAAANSEMLTRELQIRTSDADHEDHYHAEGEVLKKDEPLLANITKTSASIVHTLQVAMRLPWRN